MTVVSCRGRLWGVVLALGLCALAFAPAAIAAPGDLDPSFGNGGKSIVDLGATEQVSGLLLQPDGNVIVTGSTNALSTDRNLFAARLRVPQGTLDPAYGGGSGWSQVNLGGDDRSGGAALQPDGRIVLAGGIDSVEDDYGVARLLNPQGTFDPSFGIGGRRNGLRTGADGAFAMALQPDGKIVFAGFQSGPGGEDWLIGRLVTPQATPDASFGSGGFTTTNQGGTADEAYDVLVQPDGKVLVAGASRNQGSGYNLGDVQRLLPGGTPDDDFGNSSNVGSLGQAMFTLALQPDGKILAGGVDGSQMVVYRLLPNGTLDDSFGGGDGRSGAGGFSSASDLLVQPDGKIIAVGSADIPSGEAFGIARLQPNGILDTSFGNGGKTTIDFGPPNPYQPASGVVQQPDGKLIVAGYSQQSNIDVARLQGDPPGKVKGKCGGKKATIVGTNGKDKLKGTRKRDVISAGKGKDTVKGLKGNDLICGGKGRDKLIGGPGKDKLFGQQGNDTLLGGPQKDKLKGGPGRKDKVNGGPGNDSEKP
jgi:uncharacterized delta-60 repeat protein